MYAARGVLPLYPTRHPGTRRSATRHETADGNTCAKPTVEDPDMFCILSGGGFA
jgi:hypothetical protein